MKFSKISNSVLVLADQAVFSGGSFALTFSLARLLDPKDFGTFSGLVLLGYFLMSITNALVIQPFQVSNARFSNHPSYSWFALSFQMLLVLLLAVFTLVVSHSGWLASFFPQEIKSGIFVWLAGFLLQDFFRKMALAKGNARLTLFSDLAAVAGQFLVLFYFWHHPQIHFQDLIFYLGLAYFPSLIIGLAGFHFGEIYSQNWKNYFQAHKKQGAWLLLTSVLQWWSTNLFTVASGIFIGVEALGAFRLVQSLFGILNMVFQTFENHLLPEASRLFQQSVSEAKVFLLSSFKRNGLPLLAVLLLLFIFSEEVMFLAGGKKYASYHFVIKGMAILYSGILFGYPIRLAVRMMVLNQGFFIGYLLSFAFSLLSFRFLLDHFQLWGAMAGLFFNQIIMLFYWNKMLVNKQFILWK